MFWMRDGRIQTWINRRSTLQSQTDLACLVCYFILFLASLAGPLAEHPSISTGQTQIVGNNDVVALTQSVLVLLLVSRLSLLAAVASPEYAAVEQCLRFRIFDELAPTIIFCLHNNLHTC